jgi:hypothetical protein
VARRDLMLFKKKEGHFHMALEKDIERLWYENSQLKKEIQLLWNYVRALGR